MLIEIYSSYQNASTEISERLIILDSNWLRTEKQLDFMKRIWDKLDKDHRAIQSQVLRLLVNSLEASINQIQNLEKKRKEKGNDLRLGAIIREPEYKKWKYAMIKKSLDTNIKSLEKWQQAFDPTWYLILRISDSLIDTELAKTTSSSSSARTEVASIATAKSIRDSFKAEPEVHASIFLPSSGVSSSARTSIPFTTASLLQRGPKNKVYVLDSVPSFPGLDSSVQNRDVRDLARKLTGTDPLRFGLLRCRGVVKVTNADNEIESYDFIFHIPPSLRSPKSLRDVLIQAKPDLSLSSRFHIAQQLSQSLSYVHTYGFVHKGIRPETILIFQDDESELAASFLLGFEKFRPAQGLTLRANDCAWQKDLYRHPRRQGLRPEDEYIMQHDIYSLGVCLLEIGLWQTLVVYGPSQSGHEAQIQSQDNHNMPEPSQLLTRLSNAENNETPKATLIKQSLVELALSELPPRMGDKYTDIVVSCLTCLDESNPDFSDESEFKDVDDVVIGVRYIEKVSTNAIYSTFFRLVWERRIKLTSV